MVNAHSRDSDPLLGETIADKYLVFPLIARGGMGSVYRGVQLALEREVALKVLDLRWIAQSGRSDADVADFQRRFVLEAASAAKLTHPNTVVIHDYGVEGDALLYMVMELIEGVTLAQRLDQDGPLPAETVVRIMAQVCGSLAEAHGRGMVHRDLKPSNIMLTQRGSQREFVKVLDFGLVKQDEDVSQTRSGALVGTPRYMSPEQVANTEVTPASDVYGLGACMYHALTGQPPFDSESAYLLMAAHINAAPPPMAEANPAVRVPPELELVVLRCLSKAPSDRYGSMEEVSVAMQAALGEDFTLSGSRNILPSGSTPLGRLPSKDWTDSLTDTRVRLHEASVSTLSPPRRRVGFVVAALAGLAVVALLLFMLRRTPTEVVAPPDAEPSRGETPTAEGPGARADGRVEVWIRSTPDGARVVRGGEDLGNTPARLLLGSEDRWTLTLSAPGHVTRTLRVSPAQSEVNVILEALPAALTRSGTLGVDERPGSEGVGPGSAPAQGRPATDNAGGGAVRSSPVTGEGRAPHLAPDRRTDNRDPWDDAP